MLKKIFGLCALIVFVVACARMLFYGDEILLRKDLAKKYDMKQIDIFLDKCRSLNKHKIEPQIQALRQVVRDGDCNTNKGRESSKILSQTLMQCMREGVAGYDEYSKIIFEDRSNFMRLFVYNMLVYGVFSGGKDIDTCVLNKE